MNGFDYASLMAELRKCLPEISIGALTHSILGREIPVLQIGQGERTVVYVGAHHGSESITAAVLSDFIRESLRLMESGRKIGGVLPEYLFSHWKFLVIPMLNPDGVEYAVHGVTEENPLFERLLPMNRACGKDFTQWQANARGVDLNHNYNAGFAAYKRMEGERGILNGAPSGYSGEYPESEPETAALARLLRIRKETIYGVLTLHTQGEEIFCGSKKDSDEKRDTVCRLLERSTGYQRAEPTGSALFGGLTDWCLETLRIPAFTLECGKGKNPLPMCQRPFIYERLREALFRFPIWL